MRYRVDVSAYVMRQIDSEYRDRRSPSGMPDRYDFVGGPLATAIDRFKDFDRLAQVVGPSVSVATVVDPFFGPVTFAGVLVDSDRVEIAEFVADPEFWDDPDDDAAP